MQRQPSCFDCFESKYFFHFDPDGGAVSEYFVPLAPVIT